MKILITGSTGLVGSALVKRLKSEGHQVSRLVRTSGRFEEPALIWNPFAAELEPSQLEGHDAVVHLAGEGIANQRWTAAQKKKIRESRVLGTRLLSETIAKLSQPPRVFVSASAIGYYGDRGDERLTEESPAGTGFLPDVCREWEEATRPAASAGVRTVNLRIGIVLSTQGGALAKMLTPFKLCAGGVLGSGQQFMSWIALPDLVGVIHHAISTEAITGPVNSVTAAVTNREFTKTLGRVLGRPTIFPMPAFAARLAFGEMADALLLASTRVEPSRLKATNYRFQFPDLADALKHVIANRI